MTENETPQKDITSPPEPTHEATTPPGNGEIDQADVDKGREKLDHVEAGH